MVVEECFLQEMTEPYHYPVMYREVLDFLDIKKKRLIVDCTVGIGSHAYKILEVANKETFLIGIDRDQDSLEIAAQRLAPFKGQFTLLKNDFANIDKILEDLAIGGVDAFLFDLGISLYQLNNPERGFSFLKEGPLDMRMDNNFFISAYDLVNNLSEYELSSIFKKFGEERYAQKIAHYLVEARRIEPISTTTQLANIVMRAVALRSRYQRIHPATRIFQSLRIAVNRELEVLKLGLKKAIALLNQRGRIAVICFHSLEDRITKHIFTDYASRKVLKIITKRPLSPRDIERQENPSSRSAKLRVAEKN